MDEVEKGTIVVIEAPDFFRGRKLATVLNKCKWHDDAIECLLFDSSNSTQKVCVSTKKEGDKIILLSELNNGG